MGKTEEQTKDLERIRERFMARDGKREIPENPYLEEVKEVIDHLNRVADKKFRSTSQVSINRVSGKLREDFTVEDLKTVIDNKVKDWKGTNMDKYIRPETLFGSGFEGYLNEIPIFDEVKVSPTVVEKVVYKIEGYDEYLKLMMKMDYKEYGKTEHWQHFRKEALKFYGNKCQLCNATDTEIHIHHKTYENRGRETFNDVIPLCDKCHKMVHGIES